MIFLFFYSLILNAASLHEAPFQEEWISAKNAFASIVTGLVNIAQGSDSSSQAAISKIILKKVYRDILTFSTTDPNCQDLREALQKRCKDYLKEQSNTKFFIKDQIEIFALHLTQPLDDDWLKKHEAKNLEMLDIIDTLTTRPISPSKIHKCVNGIIEIHALWGQDLQPEAIEQEKEALALMFLQPNDDALCTSLDSIKQVIFSNLAEFLHTYPINIFSVTPLFTQPHYINLLFKTLKSTSKEDLDLRMRKDNTTEEIEALIKEKTSFDKAIFTKNFQLKNDDDEYDLPFFETRFVLPQQNNNHPVILDEEIVLTVIVDGIRSILWEPNYDSRLKATFALSQVWASYLTPECNISEVVDYHRPESKEDSILKTLYTILATAKVILPPQALLTVEEKQLDSITALIWKSGFGVTGEEEMGQHFYDLISLRSLVNTKYPEPKYIPDVKMKDVRTMLALR